MFVSIRLVFCLRCMPYYGMPEEYASQLEAAETFISLLFIGEMVFKLVGLGCRGYWCALAQPCTALHTHTRALARAHTHTHAQAHAHAHTHTHNNY